VAIAPALVGVLFLLVESGRSARDLAAAVGLAVLAAIHVLYWWRPWPGRQRRAVAAAGAMVVTNLILLNLLGVAQPLLWLYPALIAGAGLRAPMAVVGVGLTALATTAPMALEGGIIEPLHPLQPGPTLSLLGLVCHMTEVERSWFRRRIAGEDAPPLYYSKERPDDDFDAVDAADPAAMFSAFNNEVELCRAVALA